MLQRQVIIRALKRLKNERVRNQALAKLKVTISEDDWISDSCLDLIALHINPMPPDGLIDTLVWWAFEEPKEKHRIKYDGEWVNVDDAGDFYDMMIKIFSPNQPTQKESGDGC